jgi:hypothetical protein
MTQPASPYEIGGGMTMPAPSPYVQGPATPPAADPVSGLKLPPTPPTTMQPAAISSAHLRDAVATLADENGRRKGAAMAELVRNGAVSSSPEVRPSASNVPPEGVHNPFAAKATAGGGPSGPGAPIDYYKAGAAPSGRAGGEDDTAAQGAAERLAHQEQVKNDLEVKRERETADSHIQAEQHHQAGVELAAKHLGEVQQSMKEDDARIRQSQQDLASDKIDPDHIYGAHKTAGKLLAGIGMAIGAYGASMGHHANFAADYIKNAIDTDIDAQKANHAAKRDKVQGYINNYDRHRQAGMDSAGAEAASREDAYKHALSMGDAQAEKSGSNILRQNWQTQRAALESDAAKAEQERIRQQKIAGYNRLQAAAAAAAKPSSIDEQTAKADLENQDVAAAAGRLREAPEGELAGYGTGGKLRHFASQVTPFDFESNDAKSNRKDVDTLASHELKRNGGRVNSDEIARVEHHVRDEEDVRRLAKEEAVRAMLERSQARRGVLGGKGGGGGSKRGEEE